MGLPDDIETNDNIFNNHTPSNIQAVFMENWLQNLSMNMYFDKSFHKIVVLHLFYIVG